MLLSITPCSRSFKIRRAKNFTPKQKIRFTSRTTGCWLSVAIGVLSHLQLTHRTMLFGNLTIPVAGVHWLGTLPEFRNQGFASRLLQETDRRMAAAGAARSACCAPVFRISFVERGWALSVVVTVFSQAKSGVTCSDTYTTKVRPGKRSRLTFVFGGTLKCRR